MKIYFDNLTAKTVSDLFNSTTLKRFKYIKVTTEDCKTYTLEVETK